MAQAYYLKELTPVIYGKKGLRILSFSPEASCPCFHNHWHERMEILRIDRGSMEFVVDGVSYAAESGDTVVFPPRCCHEGTAGDKGVSYRVFMFDTDLFGFSFQQLSQLRRCIRDPELASLLDSLSEAFRSPDSNVQTVTGFLYLLIGTLMSRYADAPENRFPALTDDEFSQRILLYMEENLSQPLTCRELAQTFGYTEAAFCRKFRTDVGATVTEHLRDLRLTHAAQLLRNTGDGIRKIAAACSFDDPNYFSRLFRRKYGVTPRDFRKAARRERSGD